MERFQQSFIDDQPVTCRAPKQVNDVDAVDVGEDEIVSAQDTKNLVDSVLPCQEQVVIDEQVIDVKAFQILEFLLDALQRV